MSYTFEEINNILDSIGYPYNYDFFPENKVPAPPYMVFYYPNRDDFYADDSNFTQIEQLNIELYTDEKDFDAEEAVESKLRLYGITFQKQEAYIESENLYQVLYIMEVVINGN